MKHSIRNTLILALTLLLLTGGGWLILHMTYSTTLQELEETREERHEVLQELEETAGYYDQVALEHAEQVNIRDNFPKHLFEDHQATRIYSHLIELNRGMAYTNFNYSLGDSTTNEGYGIIRFNLSGEGEYRNLYNFVHGIENSSSVIQIVSLQVDNINELGRLSRVTYQMDLEAYYNRDDQVDTGQDPQLAEPFGNITHNPFYPMAHPIPENEEDLLEVDESTLLAITSRFVMVEDQNGEIRRLTPGDRVFLGSMRRINTDTRSATFLLNRGGFLDQVTLSME